MKLQVFEWVGGSGVRAHMCARVCVRMHTGVHVHECMYVLIASVSSSLSQPVQAS